MESEPPQEGLLSEIQRLDNRRAVEHTYVRGCGGTVHGDSWARIMPCKPTRPWRYTQMGTDGWLKDHEKVKFIPRSLYNNPNWSPLFTFAAKSNVDGKAVREILSIDLDPIIDLSPVYAQGNENSKWHSVFTLYTCPYYIHLDKSSFIWSVWNG